MRKNFREHSSLYWLFLVFIILFGLYEGEAWSKDARTIRISERRTATIYIHPGRSTILNFPSKPTKVVLGSKGLFAIEYVENDLAVSVLSGTARSNLFVYVSGRRFAFDLVTTSAIGDEIVLVRDDLEREIPLKVK